MLFNILIFHSQYIMEIHIKETMSVFNTLQQLENFCEDNRIVMEFIYGMTVCMTIACMILKRNCLAFTVYLQGHSKYFRCTMTKRENQFAVCFDTSH